MCICPLDAYNVVLKYTIFLKVETLVGGADPSGGQRSGLLGGTSLLNKSLFYVYSEPSFVR